MKKVSCKLKIEIFDRDGNKIDEYEKDDDYLMRSIIGTIQAWDGGNIIIIDQAGNTRSISISSITSMETVAPAGDDNFGILIGSSSTSVNIHQSGLGSKYLNSQFAHGAMPSITYGSSPANAWITWKRSFTNNTASNQVIREVGLVGKLVTSTGTYYCILTRDVISDRTVQPNGSVNVEITIYINSPPS